MELTHCFLGGRAYLFTLSEAGISYCSYVNIINTKQHRSPEVRCVYVFASSNDFTVWIFLVVDFVKRVMTWFYFFPIDTAIEMGKANRTLISEIKSLW